jgi:hypothetical protein
MLIVLNMLFSKAGEKYFSKWEQFAESDILCCLFAHKSFTEQKFDWKQ